jgi:hypothetical protein
MERLCAAAQRVSGSMEKLVDEPVTRTPPGGVSEVLISKEISHTNFYGNIMISLFRAAVSVLLVHRHQAPEVMINQHL